jgi:phage FluMu gp28-like protein
VPPRNAGLQADTADAGRINDEESGGGAAALRSAAHLEPPASRRHAGTMPAAPGPAIHLLPYQRRWVEDDSKLKIAVKARQIGYSFAATLRAVFQCLARKTTWIFLSKGERQSRLLMEKVHDHLQTCGIVARASESTYFEGTSLKQLEVRFPNGSVIYGLPANPDTARGYTGHVTLDEFAFHSDAGKIYAALFPTITRGYGIEVISTPNGTQGKFYELAKAAGLVEQVSGVRRPVPGQDPGARHAAPGTWSAHYCDVYDAVRQGLQIDIELLRRGCEDESSWQQEFCCAFISSVENFFSPELLAACLSAEASTDSFPPRPLASARGIPGTAGVAPARGQDARAPGASPEYFLGIDIGRRHDRTVLWVDEVQVSGAGFQAPGSIADTRPLTPDTRSVARLVRSLENTPFDEQWRVARELLRMDDPGGQPLIRRACIDSTGLGAHMAETLQKEFGPRVEPVVFTAAVKEDLAFRTRRRMEAGATLLPDTRDIRRAFSAVKKLVTPGGNVRFDAARTEAGHADEFWAKALADLAADPEARAAASRATDAFLVEASPLVAARAFCQIDAHWSAFAW